MIPQDSVDGICRCDKPSNRPVRPFEIVQTMKRDNNPGSVKSCQGLYQTCAYARGPPAGYRILLVGCSQSKKQEPTWTLVPKPGCLCRVWAGLEMLNSLLELKTRKESLKGPLKATLKVRGTGCRALGALSSTIFKPSVSKFVVLGPASALYRGMRSRRLGMGKFLRLTTRTKLWQRTH